MGSLVRTVNWKMVNVGPNLILFCHLVVIFMLYVLKKLYDCITRTKSGVRSYMNYKCKRKKCEQVSPIG